MQSDEDPNGEHPMMIIRTCSSCFNNNNTDKVNRYNNNNTSHPCPKPLPKEEK